MFISGTTHIKTRKEYFRVSAILNSKGYEKTRIIRNMVFFRKHGYKVIIIREY